MTTLPMTLDLPSQYIENVRFVVTQQIQIGRRIARVKNQVHALLEMNMIQHELDDMTDIFGIKGLKKLSKIQLPREGMIALARYLDQSFSISTSMLPQNLLGSIMLPFRDNDYT